MSKQRPASPKTLAAMEGSISKTTARPTDTVKPRSILKTAMLVCVALALALGATFVIFAAIAFAPRTTRLNGYLANPKLLKGASAVFELHHGFAEDLASGDDSELDDIYRMQPAAISNLLDSNVVFKDCASPVTCTQNPTWRPLKVYIDDSHPDFSESSVTDRTVLQIYRQLTSASDTVCAAADTVISSDGSIPPDRRLVCISPQLGLVSLEYISRDNARAL